MLTAVFTFGLFMTSCEDDQSMDAPRVEVFLTDDPGAFDAVNVEIIDVQVNSGNEDAGWESLEGFNASTVNLLDYTAGLDTLLGAIDIPEGRLSQIRLILGENNSVEILGQIISLNTPSAQQSGLKVLINEDLQAGVVYKLILDFDAGRSVVEAGNSGIYNLKPVIRASLEAQSGSISGLVQPDSVQTLVTALNTTDTISSFTNSDGVFLLRGVPAGNYEVLFSPADTLFQEQMVSDVDVMLNQNRDLGTITLN